MRHLVLISLAIVALACQPHAGPTGAAGSPGDPGQQGLQGPRGEPGEKGDNGNKGEKAAQGLKGAPRETGAQELKGDPGETGEMGPKGDTGSCKELLWDPAATSDDIIHTDGAVVYARNGTTGEQEYAHTDAATVIWLEVPPDYSGALG